MLISEGFGRVQHVGFSFIPAIDYFISALVEDYWM